MADDAKGITGKLDRLKNYTDCSDVPEKNLLTLAKISLVIDEYIEDYHLGAITLRCWNDMETILRVCPCVLLSELNDRGIVASCEIDMFHNYNARDEFGLRTTQRCAGLEQQLRRE